MKASEVYASQYLNAKDLPAKGVVCVISTVKVTKLQGNDKPKVVLELIGAKKGVVVNKTNGTILAQLLGDDLDTWPGCSVTLAQRSTMFQGQMVPSVAVTGASRPATANDTVEGEIGGGSFNEFPTM